MTLVIVIIIAALLYFMAYSARRRFGVLGLGLAAGTVLVRAVGGDVSAYIAGNRVPVAPLTYETTAIVALTLLPALLLLAGGPTYIKKKQARMGALLFAILATLLILGPLTVELPTNDVYVRQFLEATAKWQGYITAIGVAVAVMDVLMYKPPKEAPAGK